MIITEKELRRIISESIHDIIAARIGDDPDGNLAESVSILRNIYLNSGTILKDIEEAAQSDTDFLSGTRRHLDIMSSQVKKSAELWSDRLTELSGMYHMKLHDEREQSLEYLQEFMTDGYHKCFDACRALFMAPGKLTLPFMHGKVGTIRSEIGKVLKKHVYGKS